MAELMENTTDSPVDGNVPTRTDAEVGPVSVVITWDVAPGREAAFEEWAHGITAAGSRYPGHLGSNWFRLGPASRRYRTVLKFSNPVRFRDWFDSEERASWLRQVEGFARRDESQLTGLETWFDLPGVTTGSPPRWKMFLVTVGFGYPVSLGISLLLYPQLDWLPLVPRSLVGTALLVGILTWLVLPRATKLLRGWLYPTQRDQT